MADQIISRLLLGLDTKEFRNGIRNADRGLQDFSKNIKNIGNLIGASFAVGAIQDFAIEAVKLGDQLNAATNGFKRFGDAADLEKLRQATKNMVSDVQLMQQAIQAGNFGIPIEELGNLFAFAQQRAKETGQEVDYLTNSIVTGIGRKSPLILDNLGISAVQLKEKLGGVSAEAASIADVTRAVSEIATEELAKMGSSADDTSTKMQQLTVRWQNWKAEAGTAISSFVADVVKSYDTVTSYARLFSTLVGGSIAAAFNGPKQGGSWKLATKEMNQVLHEQNLAMDRIKKTYELFNPVVEKTVTTIGGLKEKVKLLQDQLENTDVSTAEFRRLREEIFKLNEQINKLTNPVRMMPQEKELKLISKGLVQVTDTVSGMTLQVQKAAPVIKGFGDAWQYTSEQLALFNELGGSIGRILSESFNAALINGESFFKTFIRGLKQMVAQILATAAAAAALAIALMALGVPGVKGLNFGQTFSGLYKAMGGFGADYIDFGNPAAAGSNILGGGGGRTILRGNDIFVSNSRTNFDISRIGG